jgi:hypothetical protein
MWNVFGGSARGRSHLASDSACQDYSAWRTFGGGLCVAIADGAGSRPRAGEGARTAVGAVLDWSQETITGGRLTRPLDQAFHRARASLLELASGLGSAPEDFATTLAVAVVDATSVRIGQVGDSIGVIARTTGGIEAVAPCRRSEYVNDTAFLTDETWQADLRLSRFPVASVMALSLATDGLQYKILADVAQGVPYTPFFRDLFAWAAHFRGGSESLLQYLDELDDDQSDDDKTLVVAVRASPDLATAPGPRPLTRTAWPAQAPRPATRWTGLP